MGGQQDPTRTAARLACDHVLADGWHPSGFDTQMHLLAHVTFELCALSRSHVRVRDIEIAVLEERERILGADELRVAFRRRDDGRRGGTLAGAIDPLVRVGVVEGEVLGHQLSARKLASDQQNRAGDALSVLFDLLDPRDADERGTHIAGQRVGADMSVDDSSRVRDGGRAGLPLDAVEGRDIDLESE